MFTGRDRERVKSLFVVACILAVIPYGCSKDSTVGESRTEFDEQRKTGDLSLTIIGDYFSPAFVREFVAVAAAQMPDSRQVVVCTEPYATALRPLLTGRGVRNVDYGTLDPSSRILTQWGRDIAVAGRRGGATTIVVSPNRQATNENESDAMAALLRQLFPEHTVEIAPFVFEGGNVMFLRSGSERVLIVGRKVLFDNEVYQQRPWMPGYDGDALLKAIAKTFGVDRVLVVGRTPTRPDTRLYFEYHIDMGMVMLDGNRAVVSRLDFGENQREALAVAIHRRDPVISRFAWMHADSVHSTLSHRLATVSLEYEDYAALLDSLGVDVHRSPVNWQHVLGSMSWTNVVQIGNRILMPMYPDSLRAVTKSVEKEGGQVRVSLDVSDVGAETFALEGLNLQNQQLYRSLGYEVTPVPEYLHYMGGGLHCFVNVLE